ncbi:hypothetical protein BBO99_00002695 [Phytophthora kernoviae]|uniref:Uncharacterized protein n=1 Tax=Phytophthora kernoviae TaxID=325452 RepID=A0A421FB42_9STRA|nr:hypothetical protein BBI17_002666 [Phytophthora kernoviae]RLN82749.1 hypothetical protein BBO99_00002695 [Phytophthora kernoviae]
MDDDAPEGQKKPKKRVRYLRDIDRRNIIKRIENGEKQAALAREFGVTRAAICHIKKNKDEILSRYNFLVKSAHDMDIAENFSGPSGVNMMVHEIRYNSVLLLMTMLRDSRSTGATFRRVAGRLIMILLEEALAIVGTLSMEVVTGTGHLYQGLKLKHQFCGVAIGAEGYPFLVLFHQMEPQAPQGSIHVEMAADRQGQQVWRLDHMDLPANITQHKILLFSSACSTGEVECKAIDVSRLNSPAIPGLISRRPGGTMFALTRLARTAPAAASLPTARGIRYMAPPRVSADSTYRFGLKLDDVEAQTEEEKASLNQLKAVLSLRNASQHELNKAQVSKAIETFQRFPGDTGSSEVQVAVLTQKILRSTTHAQGHKKDHHSRRGLIAMVEKRRKLLKYLRRKDLHKFRDVVAALGLRFT